MARSPNSAELSSEQDDSDHDSASTPAVTLSSEKRRIRRAHFTSWKIQDAAREIENDTKRENKTVADEEQSIRQLLASESPPIIADPREYQIELFERAKHQNTIAVLDTGSGKTLIAVLLLRHTIDQELERRHQGNPRRIAFFLVPSVTLVFQQAAVLETNLDHSVERFCGAMKCDLWNKNKWDTYLTANEVIVCTADILYKCLMHSFITMRDISLLIFDEAHHAKKNHAYAQIIRDFYVREPDIQLRPRVFGMTASPVDAKVDVSRAANELESILCSQIATTYDLVQLQKTIVRPQEHIGRYLPAQQHPLETDLYRRLKDQCGHLDVLAPLFEKAMDINSRMGRWCADFYWTFALSDKKAQKMEGVIHRSSTAHESPAGLDDTSIEVGQIKEAINAIFNHPFGHPCMESPDISYKIFTLYNYLQQYFERPSDHRCIVFVEQRVDARLLNKVFELAENPNLRPGVLTGSGSGRLDDLKATFRSQIMTLRKFRKGELNCLFATSVAEEGLDVPDCNLIVRFDLCQTMIQYVQSRGRARHKNSKLLHMLEINNTIHDRTLQDIRRNELLMRKFCEAPPETRRLNSSDEDLLGELSSTDDCFTVPATGAKITLGTCLQILTHFVDCSTRDSEASGQAHFITTSVAGKFVCEILLPEGSPIRSVVGLLASKKAYAKRSAAFEACKKLHGLQYLDDNLVPIHRKIRPAMRNAALALNVKSKGNHIMRVKPSEWEDSLGVIPGEVYLTIMDVSDGLERPHQPLVLVTRVALPEFPEFPLFLKMGTPTLVRTRCSSIPLAVSQEELEKLTHYTLRVFQDLFNKTYAFDVSQTPYWLAPAAHGPDAEKSLPHISQWIDWQSVNLTITSEEHTWTKDMDNEFLLDKFLVDRWDGGRRFFSKKIAAEYRPLDPVPANTAVGRWNENILGYTVSLWEKARKLRTWDEEQPVMEAEKVLHRRNLLAEPHEKEDNLRTRCFLCPEPLKISTLTPKIVTMCYVFPAIIHRIDSYLIASELCMRLGLSIDVGLALEAVTKDSNNSEVDEEQEQITFQRGMGNNYERLEFLGDCFLKMATSISVFVRYPNANEFEFHVKRMLLLCNKNLLRVGQSLGIHEYIRTQSFSRRTWYPNGMKLLAGKGWNSSGKEVIMHTLGDKTIADVCEAVMGAAFLTHNDTSAWTGSSWDNAVMAVTKLVGDPDHAMMAWADYSRAYNKPNYQTMEASGSIAELARKVELLHPYHFKHPRLLRSAFNHPSLPTVWTDGVPSYQRLEFLGDALLDMACISHIFYGYPDKNDHWLSEHKQAMCGNQFFGALSVKLGFHRHILHHSDVLLTQIKEYVEDLEYAERMSNGAKDFWTTLKDPPKFLSDMVEAYVGAIFIDSDFDYNEVQRFFDQNIKPYFEDMTMYDTYASSHPVTQLLKMCQDHFGCHECELVLQDVAVGDGTTSEMVAGLMIHDYPRPLGPWRAKSGGNAKIRASLAAMDELKGIAPVEFRAKYGCDCDKKGNNDIVLVMRGA